MDLRGKNNFSEKPFKNQLIGKEGAALEGVPPPQVVDQLIFDKYIINEKGTKSVRSVVGICIYVKFCARHNFYKVVLQKFGDPHPLH